MKHHKDRHGQQLHVGQRVLIPAKIVNLSPEPGHYGVTLILEEKAGQRVPTEVVLNGAQIEVHPHDNPPTNETPETPAPTTEPEKEPEDKTPEEPTDKAPEANGEKADETKTETPAA